MNRLMLLGVAIVVLASAACAPAVPTVDPAQIQASAVAAASTMVALTQLAIPTPTPVPPTPLPSPTALPSPTFVTLPTLPPSVSTVAPPPTASGDACNKPLAPSPEGPMMTVTISNNTDGLVTLSLYLYKTPFGECGYWGTRLKARGSASATLPQGYYFAGAFVDDPKAKTKSFGTSINMQGSDKYHLSVGAETIQLR